MPLCAYIGDSIALLLQLYDPGCMIAAKIGASAAYIDQHFAEQGANDYTILSVGSNQPSTPGNLTHMIHLRTRIHSRVIWILPYDRSIAARVKTIALTERGLTIDLAPFPSADKIHPTPTSAHKISSLISYANGMLRRTNNLQAPLPH